MRVSILIATYRRPESLLRLLRSLENLTFGNQDVPTLEVVVVDNDASGSGVAAVNAAISGTYRWPLRVVTELQPGISEARNRSVAEAERPDFVAFVDDDEYVSPQWLDELLAVQRLTGAEAVLGPVVPVLPAGVSEWLQRGGFFERPREADASEVSGIRTSNVLLRWQSLCDLDPPVFDPSFSATGGGDTHLGMRLLQRGARFRWADSAVVWEEFPEGRANVSWLSRRWFRLGVSLALVERHIDDSWRQFGKRLAKGIGRVAIALCLLLPALLFGRIAVLKAVRMLVFGVGMVVGLTGLRYEEYRRRP